MPEYTADEHVDGTFNAPIPCPECGQFMSTDYCPAGLPAANCHNARCRVDGVPDDWLKRNGYWEEN